MYDSDFDNDLFDGPDSDTIDEEEEEEEVGNDEEGVDSSTITLSPMESRKCVIVQTQEQLEEMCQYLSCFDEIAFDTETTGLNIFQDDTVDKSRVKPGFRIVGISLAAERHIGFYIPLGHVLPEFDIFGEAPVQLPRDAVLDRLDFIWHDKKIIAHNLKFDYEVMLRHGKHIKKLYFCTMLAQHILKHKDKAGLKSLTRSYLKREATDISDVMGESGNIAYAPIKLVADYAVADALNCLDLYFLQRARFREVPQLAAVFRFIEMDALPIIAEMEIVGMKVDQEAMSLLKDALSKAAGKLEKELYEHIKELQDTQSYIKADEFNPANPAHVEGVLENVYDVQDIPYSKGRARTDGTQPKSVDRKALKKIRQKYRHKKDPRIGSLMKFLNLMMEWRDIKKIHSTYTEALLEKISGTDGKLHPNFLQSGTVTGRLSCKKPNLMNLPRRKDDYNIRSLFTVDDPETECFVSADYKALEMRITACTSGDKDLVDIILGRKKLGDLGDYEGVVSKRTKDGKPIVLSNSDPVDIHMYTVFKVDGVPYNLITEDNRTDFKPVGFGILYGISKWGLADNLNIKENEAERRINGWLGTFPGVAAFIKSCKKFIVEHQYMSTCFGRVREVMKRGDEYEGLQLRERRLEKSGVLRALVNARIQGTAADVMKMAMARIRGKLNVAGLGYAKVVLQIHDEIVVKCLQKDAEAVANIVLSSMYTMLTNTEMGIAIPLEGDAKATLTLSKSDKDLLEGKQLWQPAA